jgi:hypothetical protein
MVRKITLKKCESQILHMGLSTADSKQVLCHMILFKVLSLRLLRSLCMEPTLEDNTLKVLHSERFTPYLQTLD